MTIAEWCIFAAVLMPYAWVYFAKFTPGGAGRYNNRFPREYLTRVQGMPSRANAAHLNAFEAFAPFAVAVLLAQKYAVAQTTIDTLALTFIGARVLHGALYLIDKHWLRSLVWLVGFLCVIVLFVLAGTR